MEADPWSRSSAASGRRQNDLQSRFAVDLYIGFEDVDGGVDESRADFPCPFCAEDFDIAELCFHIDDEHPAEAKSGMCPVCEDRVGMDMVGHIIMQHGNFFKLQHRRRSCKGSGSHYTLSLLKKDLREGHIQALRGGSSFTIPPSAAPDPLLSSFMYNFPIVDPVKDVQLRASDKESVASKILDSKSVERKRYVFIGSVNCAQEVIICCKCEKQRCLLFHVLHILAQDRDFSVVYTAITWSWYSYSFTYSIEPPVSDKDHEEKARRCDFVQELMLSTIFEGRS